MLPSAKKSLEKGGSSSREAAWILIAAFLGGVFGIQFFSKIIHRYMPSQAVDCDHSHDNENPEEMQECNDAVPQGTDSQNTPDHKTWNAATSSDSEETPLLSRRESNVESPSIKPGRSPNKLANGNAAIDRPSLQSRVTATMANIVRNKAACDTNGPCYGFTNPCGQDCFKKVSMRGGARQWFERQPKPGLRRAASTSMGKLDGANETTMHTRLHDHMDAASRLENSQGHAHAHEHDLESQTLEVRDSRTEQQDLLEHDHDVDEQDESSNQHHHHIPQNAFLSISLQTSIAIALHKLPEGFITYATNHANPTLGVAVFVAIGIHNISEGFALALPIFLASNSRLKALLLTIVLGGLSQPVGAGVAAAWLRIAERGRGSDAGRDISDGAYGTMFAVTAGIMASVALSLLQESFELSHNRNLCMVFTFVGMGILGMSSALTA